MGQGTVPCPIQTYANGQLWSYTYNDFDDLVSRFTGTGNDRIEFQYYYNSEGALARVEEYRGGTRSAVQRYYYDSLDRLTRCVEARGTDVHEYAWTYDQNDNVTSLTETINGESFTESYTYNSDQQPTGVNSRTLSYDSYGRLSSAVNGPLTTAYSYRNIGTDYTTTQVATLTNSFTGGGETLSYTYDNMVFQGVRFCDDSCLGCQMAYCLREKAVRQRRKRAHSVGLASLAGFL